LKDTDFLGMSSYVRVKEKSLLSGAGLERIADAPSTAEALRMLSQQSDYDFSNLRRPEDYETVVKAEQKRAFEMAYDLAAECPAVVGIIGAKYDYHNVKAALKAKYQGGAEDIPLLELTSVSAAEILLIVRKYDPKSSLPAHILAAIRAGEDAYEKSGGNPQMIDVALDRLLYAHMGKLAAELGNDFITGYVKNAIDYYNLKTLVRARSMQKGTAFLASALAEGGATDPALFTASYGKAGGALALAFAFKGYGAAAKAGMESFERTGNYSELERLLDNLLIRYVRDAKSIPFGLEVLFGYLVAKESEIRQVRILVACKQNGIAPERLRERLRENYV
jgi:V/A-type H+-transporting ATPase subunit C